MFTLNIDTSNAAFGEDDQDRGWELSRIIGRVAKHVQEGVEVVGHCIDSNGNVVGSWSVDAEAYPVPEVVR